MRHVYGAVLGVVLLAVLFLAAGWGVAEIAALHARGTTLTGPHGLVALAAVLGAGLLLGLLLAVPAISPIAAGLPGLLLLGWAALALVSPGRATRLIPLPGHSFAAGFASLLTTGVLLLVGAAMVVPLFVPSRWRRRPAEYDYADEPSDLGLLRLGSLA